MSMQQDLQFLLGEGWRLLDLNTVESPDGKVLTSDIEKAARVWRAKMKAQELIKENHWTKKSVWGRIARYLFVL